MSADVKARPLYIPVGNEVEIFRAAHRQRLAVMLKGPTGVGKTRLVEAIAHDLGRPLITIACHEDLTAADLVGRYLLKGQETVWEDGPLTRGVREGAIVYLDEVVEARSDTIVILHPLADHRRVLQIDRIGEEIPAHPDFLLVVSYNPGYQSVLKDMKVSTRQRMVAIELGFPPPAVEVEILMQETGIDRKTAEDLVKLAQATRQVNEPGLPEGASTRTLVSTARLIQGGLSPYDAARAALVGPLSDDATVVRGLLEMIKVYLAN